MYKNRNLDPLSSNPQNGQTHSHNSSSKADKLIECVWPFCGVGAQRVKWDTLNQVILMSRKFSLALWIWYCIPKSIPSL